MRLHYIEVELSISIGKPWQGDALLYYQCSTYVKIPSIVLWCNGSTSDFGSACPSSSLGRTTKSHSNSVGRVADL